MMRIAAITCAVALAAFGAFAAEPGQAQPAPVDVRASQGSVSVRLTAPTSRIEAGQPLAMELTIEATQGDAFEVPRIGAALGSFDVLSSSRQTGQSDGVRRATLRFTVLTLDSGEVTLPAIPVAITREDGSRGTVDAGPVTLTVSSLMGGQFDPAALRDIKGPVTIDVGWAWWWLVAACAAGAMALLAALSLWRNRALRLAAPVPAHEWALAELESLERDALPESGQTHSSGCGFRTSCASTWSGGLSCVRLSAPRPSSSPRRVRMPHSRRITACFLRSSFAWPTWSSSRE